MAGLSLEEEREILTAFPLPNPLFFCRIGEGICHLHFLHRGERYEMTWPNVAVKGIFLGKLRMEMAGNVYVKCEETGYLAELEFKNKVLV